METPANTAIGKLFYPTAVAVVGASGNLKNLGSRNLKLIKEFGYSGKLYAVNPRAESCFGAPGYRHVVDIPEPVDSCCIVVPAKAVLDVVADCVEKGVPVAQILTSGFGETGTEGRKTEAAILEKAAGRTRIVGPNCMGVHATAAGLTFVATAERAEGTVSIGSQSGGLSIDMILQAKARGLRLSKLVSMGNCLDLDPVDFLDYFGQDAKTEVIGLYLEGIRRGEAFMNVLRRTALKKPVVILKGGRTEQGAQSVASHTNVLAGEYPVWQAAVKQAGAVMVDDGDAFLAALTALQKHIASPKGPGVALVGNGGGATVLATDLLEEKGLTLAPLSEQSKTVLSEINMPAGATVGNPTDTPIGALNKGGGESLGQVMNCLVSDPTVHSMIVHFNLSAFINYDNRRDIAEGVATSLMPLAGREKPVYVALRATPDQALEALRVQILETIQQIGLPCFHSATEAAKTLATVYHWRRRPGILSDVDIGKASPKKSYSARKIIQHEQQKGRFYVSQTAAFKLLEIFDIPHPACKLTKDASEAAAAAKAIGFPVVLKIDSPDILHKTDVSGVCMGLQTEQEVKEAFEDINRKAFHHHPEASINGVLVQSMCAKPLLELICGLKRDPVFGPILLLGMGGVMVEILGDVSMRIAPVSRSETHQMWKELSGVRLLEGFRGRPETDTDALEDLLQKVAILGESVPEICEMDLNPVMIMEAGSGLSVVDCRIVLDREKA